MKPQNIFDDQTFFEGYKKIRENPYNANELIEKPAIFRLLPDLTNRRILDLGCGYGENCKAFSALGAAGVVGIDVSEKMLQIAVRENSGDHIAYHRMPMEEIHSIDDTFDVVVSSLAVHYIKDFDQLVRDVYSLLCDGGIFLFSQEHPLTTAPIAGARWSRGDDGRADHYILRDYGVSGQRSVSWMVDGIIKYHRTFSDVVNALSTGGFRIETMLEPIPTPDIIQKDPTYVKGIHKPDFLIIKAKKQHA